MRLGTFVICIALVGGTAVGVAESPPPLAGYSRASGQAEQRWEEKFRSMVEAEKIRRNDKYLSAFPHFAGTPQDRKNVAWILSRFKQYGWDAHIETFYVLLPTPRRRLVEMIAPTHYQAKLEEPTVPADPTSSQHRLQMPTYNVYSADGDVTAPLVYVNYGMREDYQQLKQMGISVRGAIVIARYGIGWRGLKPKLAAEHGAIGCLIYSDPHDDGYWHGDVYPQGPWRPSQGVQRGSVMDILKYPGDPLTPNIGATRNAKRLPVKSAPTIAKIPVLPLSYSDAQPLLAAISGPVVPPSWRGALPITYHVGPGPAEVHLVVKSNWNVTPIWDVIAKIPGSSDPNEWVIRGNHQDAWVNGADDPLASFSAELEEARSLGNLLKQGWRPKRTIIYCAWDGEEPMLLGSTEWVEEHYAELLQHAAIYINSDGNGRGYLNAAGAPSLQKFIDGVAKDVQDPETHLTVERRLRLLRISRATSPAQRAALRSGRELSIGLLGSGSDWTAFLDHAGIASLSLTFGGEGGGGVYHSIYDDFYWYTHFSDTTFVYGRALAQTVGTTVMRFADADLLPYDFTALADAVAGYVDQLKKKVALQREETRNQNQEINDGVFAAIADPQVRTAPPPLEAVPPYLDYSPLENGVARLERSAREYAKASAQAEANGGAALARASLEKVNAILIQSERMVTLSQGLPERPWYKNELYAPGLFLGYDAKALPAVQDEIELKDWCRADQQIVVVGRALDREAALIHTAAVELQQRTPSE